MKMMTISEVSRQFQVSTRMLRYYEKEGLIASTRIPDYAYRIYDDANIRRLQQILVLRKLRISVKQIAVILEDEDQVKTLEIMQDNLMALNEEIAALTVIQEIIGRLVEKLDERIEKKIRLDLLQDTDLMEIVQVLNPPKMNLKEEYSMGDLVKASNVLTERMDVRIIYLPPMTVASYQYIGENPEDAVEEKIYALIREMDLPKVKPDFRVLGFNNPNPVEGQKEYGYEMWVTVPEDADIKEPIAKKKFEGGMYAAHSIKFGDFHEWEAFIKKMQQHEEYEIDWKDPEGGLLEESLNVYNNMQEGKMKPDQMDLLLPIKKREA